MGTLFIAAALSACGGSAETEGAGENSRTTGEPGIGASREIAFARSEGTKQNRFSDIYLMNADGGGELMLTRGPDADNHPAFSPDGKRIAFSREAGKGIQRGGANIRVSVSRALAQTPDSEPR